MYPQTTSFIPTVKRANRRVRITSQYSTWNQTTLSKLGVYNYNYKRDVLSSGLRILNTHSFASESASKEHTSQQKGSRDQGK